MTDNTRSSDKIKRAILDGLPAGWRVETQSLTPAQWDDARQGMNHLLGNIARWKFLAFWREADLHGEAVVELFYAYT